MPTSLKESFGASIERFLGTVSIVDRPHIRPKSFWLAASVRQRSADTRGAMFFRSWHAQSFPCVTQVYRFLCIEQGNMKQHCFSNSLVYQTNLVHGHWTASVFFQPIICKKNISLRCAFRTLSKSTPLRYTSVRLQLRLQTILNMPCCSRHFLFWIWREYGPLLQRFHVSIEVRRLEQHLTLWKCRRIIRGFRAPLTLSISR